MLQCLYCRWPLRMIHHQQVINEIQKLQRHLRTWYIFELLAQGANGYKRSLQTAVLMLVGASFEILP